ADDGIRYFHVTGVQTCALPISGGLAQGVDHADEHPEKSAGRRPLAAARLEGGRLTRLARVEWRLKYDEEVPWSAFSGRSRQENRSEERRVGEEELGIDEIITNG